MTRRRTKQPYRDTSVSYTASMKHINDLLAKHGITDSGHHKGWREASQSYAIMVQFTHRLKIDELNQPVPISIVIPLASKPGDGRTYDKELNQVYRAMYWYLKAKFEAIAFGFDLIQEFLPHLQVRGPDGQIQGFAEIFLPRYKRALTKGRGEDVLRLTDSSGSSQQEGET